MLSGEPHISWERTEMGERGRTTLRAGLAAALIGAAAFGVVVANPASAVDVEHYVATTGADVGNCQDALNPCLTINYAVAQAGTGDIVNVAAGAYPENVVVNKSLRFRGANAGVNAGVGAGARGPESVVKSFRSTADITSVASAYGTANADVTIDGFQLDPQGDASFPFQGGTLRIGMIHLHGGSGTGTSIVNNVISGAPAYNPTTPSQMAVQGVSVASGTTEISHNRIQNLRYGALTLQSAGAGFSPLTATYDGNVVTGVSTQGLGSGGATGTVQPGATITGNQIDELGGTRNPGGIVLTNSNNVVSGNTFTSLGSGVWVDICKKFQTRNNAISDNTFVNNSGGVVWGLSQPGSACQGQTGNQEGVGNWIVGGGTIDGSSVTGNSFIGNNSAVSHGVNWSTWSPAISNGTIDLTCNWWGSATGPTSATLNPGGTGQSIIFNQAPNLTWDFEPWETADGGPCNGPLVPEVPVVRVADAEVLEVASGQIAAYVPVMLDEPASENVTVRFYTTSGSATGGNAPGVGVDFRNWGTVASPRQVVIPAGSTQAVIAPPIYADGVAESNETFTVTLASVSGGGVELSDDVDASVTIVDADNLGTTDPVLYVGNGTVFEADDGTRQLQFHVQLNRPAGASTNVSLVTANGSAVAGADFVQRGFTVKFGATEVSKIFNVTLVNDTVGESAETFSLNGAVVSGPLVEELQSSATGTILDND